MQVNQLSLAILLRADAVNQWRLYEAPEFFSDPLVSPTFHTLKCRGTADM